MDFEQLSDDYRRIEGALGFLAASYRRQPELKEIAESVGLSEYHFQRLFTHWVGISPKRFLQFVTKEGAKQLLEHRASLLDTAYEVGLSGPGRLHDLFVACEAVTPGEFKRQGEGLIIQYGFHATPFGECLLATTERGICYLAFVDEAGRPAARDEIVGIWRKARLIESPATTFPLVDRIFAPTQSTGSDPLRLHLQGTNFQIKVWEALLRIPSGQVATYRDIAAYVGAPSASRAVGNAVGRNPIPVLIPCHRVIRTEGGFGGYRYGVARKMALLGWEIANRTVSAP